MPVRATTTRATTPRTMERKPSADVGQAEPEQSGTDLVERRLLPLEDGAPVRAAWSAMRCTQLTCQNSSAERSQRHQERVAQRQGAEDEEHPDYPPRRHV